MQYKMRNDWVLVKIKNVGNVRGIEMPDSSVAGKLFIVEAIGPAVKDLEVGDMVLMKGTKGAEYFPLPMESTLIAIAQENVVLVFQEEVEEK